MPFFVVLVDFFTMAAFVFLDPRVSSSLPFLFAKERVFSCSPSIFQEASHVIIVPFF